MTTTDPISAMYPEYQHPAAVEEAIDALRKALRLMRVTKHPHTVERIRLALSSAYGARRIESNRWSSDRPRRSTPKNVRSAVLSRLRKAS